jgi:GT2 family glycosyltransferase
MKAPTVSSIIITWNRLEDIKRTLEELKNIDYLNHEIVIVDNNSTDGTSDFIRSHHPYVKLIELDQNIGMEARNIGIENSKGSYLLFLDDDSFPLPGSVSKMVDKFENDPNLSVVAFKILSPDGKNLTRKYQEFTGPAGTDGGRESWSFIACGAGLRKSMWELSGYLNKDLFFGLGEDELSLRILDAGNKIKFYPDIIAVHRRTKTNRPIQRPAYYVARNQFYLYFHHFTFLEALALITYRFLGGFKYYCLQKGSWWSYISGCTVGLLRLPYIVVSRKILKKTTRRHYFTFFKKMITSRYKK